MQRQLKCFFLCCSTNVSDEVQAEAVSGFGEKEQVDLASPVPVSWYGPNCMPFGLGFIRKAESEELVLTSSGP